MIINFYYFVLNRILWLVGGEGKEGGREEVCIISTGHHMILDCL